MNARKITPQVSFWQRWHTDLISSLAARLHNWHSLPAPSQHPDLLIKVVCVSDTHNRQLAIPDGDILIHAGDLSEKGTFDELQAQVEWLASFPHPHKIVIAGNHDFLLDPDFLDSHPERLVETPGKSRADLKWGDILYLQHQSIMISLANGRTLNVYGSPQTPFCGTWAFQYPPIRDVWHNAVPDGTDILVTHGPPRGHLDAEAQGCEHLLREVRRVKPALAVFGHIHIAHGQEVTCFDVAQNAFEDVQLGQGGLWSCLTIFVCLVGVALGIKRQDQRVTRLINAAVGGPKATDKMEAIVVHM